MPIPNAAGVHAECPVTLLRCSGLQLANSSLRIHLAHRRDLGRPRRLCSVRCELVQKEPGVPCGSSLPGCCNAYPGLDHTVAPSKLLLVAVMPRMLSRVLLAGSVPPDFAVVQRTIEVGLHIQGHTHTSNGTPEGRERKSRLPCPVLRLILVISNEGGSNRPRDEKENQQK